MKRHAASNPKRETKKGTAEVTGFILASRHSALKREGEAVGYLPENTLTRNALGNRPSQSRARERTPARGGTFIPQKAAEPVLEATIMRIFLTAAAAAALVCSLAQADEHTQPPANGDAAVGIGIICNTSQQAQQFVKLRSSGARPEQAMLAVNAGARDARACGVAAVAYVRDGTVDTMKLRDRLVQIVRINVVAGFNGSGWQRVSDLVQYAVLEGEGESV
jgi:hypothetical protein